MPKALLGWPRGLFICVHADYDLKPARISNVAASGPAVATGAKDTNIDFGRFHRQELLCRGPVGIVYKILIGRLGPEVLSIAKISAASTD